MYYRRATVDPSTAGGESRRAQIGDTRVLAGAVPVRMVGARSAAEAHLDRSNRDLRRSYETLARCRGWTIIATCVAPAKPCFVPGAALWERRESRSGVESCAPKFAPPYRSNSEARSHAKFPRDTQSAAFSRSPESFQRLVSSQA